MTEMTCANCGGQLRMNLCNETLWECRRCRTETITEHERCSWPSCASWGDTDGPDGPLCYYHAAHVGIHAENGDDT